MSEECCVEYRRWFVVAKEDKAEDETIRRRGGEKESIVRFVAMYIQAVV
jgi:hypothetical protein